MIKAVTAPPMKFSSQLPEVAERGADSERRTLILDKAEAVFLEEGFQGASMAAIAARAGCSKGTLYNYFVSKEELFLACVARQCASYHETMSNLASAEGDFRSNLAEIGRRYVAFVTGDDIVRKYRMIIAEAERSPEMARAFYASGPARGAEIFSRFLAAAAAEGKLKPLDPVRAAHQFMALCYNQRQKERLCNVSAAPAAETINEDVAEAVRVFMAAYS
jgi:AcrR family transcriptional regulator